MKEMPLDRTPCPRCGVDVMHERNRPVSLWLIPAMLDDGSHIIVDAPKNPDGSVAICDGFMKDKQTKKPSLFIRVLKRLMK